MNTMTLLMIQSRSPGFTQLHHITVLHAYVLLPLCGFHMELSNYSRLVVTGHKALVRGQVMERAWKMGQYNWVNVEAALKADYKA